MLVLLHPENKTRIPKYPVDREKVIQNRQDKTKGRVTTVTHGKLF